MQVLGESLDLMRSRSWWFQVFVGGSAGACLPGWLEEYFVAEENQQGNYVRDHQRTCHVFAQREKGMGSVESHLHCGN